MMDKKDDGRHLYHEFRVLSPEKFLDVAPQSNCYDFAMAAWMKIAYSELNTTSPQLPEIWDVAFPNDMFSDFLPPEGLRTHAYLPHRGIVYSRGVTWPASLKLQYPKLNDSALRAIGRDVTLAYVRAVGKVLMPGDFELNPELRLHTIDLLLGFNKLYPNITQDDVLKIIGAGMLKYLQNDV